VHNKINEVCEQHDMYKFNKLADMRFINPMSLQKRGSQQTRRATSLMRGSVIVVVNGLPFVSFFLFLQEILQSSRALPLLLLCHGGSVFKTRRAARR